jgi:hypothetical protein
MFAEGAPALSCDATTLYFYSNRPRGNNHLYVTTRHRLRDGNKDKDDERDRDGDDKK